MPRDTVVSWKTFALLVLLPPLALAAVVLFPLTLAVLSWLYYRGRSEAKLAEGSPERSDSAADS